MELIQISNDAHKVIINGTYENFIAKTRKEVQLKKLKNVQLANIPNIGEMDFPKLGYTSFVYGYEGKKVVYAITKLSVYAFRTPPLIAVKLPKDYYFSTSWRVEATSDRHPQFYHNVNIYRVDGKDMTIDEAYEALELYVYNFPVMQQKESLYGREQTDEIYFHKTFPWIRKVFVNEGLWRGGNGQAVGEYDLPVSGRGNRPNMDALRNSYTEYTTEKCGVQVFGYHRFWNERFHSPVADKRSEEAKKKKKLEKFRADLLYDSRLPWLVVLESVTTNLKYSKSDGGYTEGDIKLSHIEPKAKQTKVGVVISNLIDCTALSHTIQHSGMKQYEVHQYLTFPTDDSVSTVEVDKEKHEVTVFGYDLYIGEPQTSYLIVNLDGIQPNTVKEFE